MKLSTKILRRGVALLAFGSLALQSAASYAARCEYIVHGQWESGFTGAIKLTNNTSTLIDGWSVNWAYTDGSLRTGGWNAVISGNNPYTAKNMDWNAKIYPGQSVEFGVQGSKGVFRAPASIPVVTGAICGDSVGSSSRPASSTPASSTPASIAASSRPASSTPASIAASSRPVSSTPASIAASSTPTSSTPASSRPASSTPVSSTPASSTPASSTPKSST
ncbi:MAG: cellulose binding domain-containing protein, partial [Pseudomonadota bacterium]